MAQNTHNYTQYNGLELIHSHKEITKSESNLSEQIASQKLVTLNDKAVTKDLHEDHNPASHF